MPRRPWKQDPQEVILRRVLFCRKRLRPVIYQATEEELRRASGWSRNEHYRRELTWGWQVREFVSDRSFTYGELLETARQVALDHGPFLVTPLTMDHDLSVLKLWEDVVAEIRRRENRRAKGVQSLTVDEILNGQVQVQAERWMVQGVCPLCGEDLPCVRCRLPSVRHVGRGKIEPVPGSLEEADRRYSAALRSLIS